MSNDREVSLVQRLAAVPVALSLLVAVVLVLEWAAAPQTKVPFEREATIIGVRYVDVLVVDDGEVVVLAGIDVAPQEENEAGWFIEKVCPRGSVVGLDVDDLRPTDQYGRTVAVVYVRGENEWINLNALLVVKGYAVIREYGESEFNPQEWEWNPAHYPEY